MSKRFIDVILQIQIWIMRGANSILFDYLIKRSALNHIYQTNPSLEVCQFYLMAGA